MRQRFQIRTLTGYHGNRFARKPITTFYVMDSVYAWRVVHETYREREALREAETLNNTPRLRMAPEWYAA